MALVAVIEPDDVAATALATALRQEGHLVTLYPDSAAALNAFRASPPDLVLSPLRSRGINGHEILRHARNVSPQPQVVLYSPHRDEVDEIAALKLGADDFLSPTPSAAVVAARVGAILRRAAVRLPGPSDAREGPQHHGSLSFDVGRRSCTLNGHLVDLTALEAAVLGALLAKPGAVLSRERLTELLYGPHADVDRRIVDSQVKRLRTKFRTVSPNFDPIETIYRAGYRLRTPPHGAETSESPEFNPQIKGFGANSLTPSGPS